MRSHTSARGRAASGDSPGATSWRGTTANTPAPSLLSATTVTGLSKHASPSFSVSYMFFFTFLSERYLKYFHKHSRLCFNIVFGVVKTRCWLHTPKCVLVLTQFKSVLAGLLMCAPRPNSLSVWASWAQCFSSRPTLGTVQHINSEFTHMMIDGLYLDSERDRGVKWVSLAMKHLTTWDINLICRVLSK